MDVKGILCQDKPQSYRLFPRYAAMQIRISLSLIVCPFFFNVWICSADDGDRPVIAPIQNPTQLFQTPDYTGDFLERRALLGDVADGRQSLANKGVTLDGNLTQVLQGVSTGGVKEGEEYMGRGEVTLNIDTSKAGLWPGGLFTVMGEGNFGTPLTKNTGALLGVNANDLLPQPDNGFVIPQVTFTQFFSPKFGIVVGKLATITNNSGDMNEFAHGKGGEKFLNPTLNFNPVTALTMPYSTLGVSFIYLPVSELVIAGGVMDPHGTPDSAGFDELFSNGATMAFESRYTTSFFGKTGHQLLGATFSTSDYTELDQRAANLIFPGLPIQEANDSWSVYWNFDQYLYSPAGDRNKGVGIFARYGLSDGEANPIENFASFGCGGKGVVPGRENDGFGLGYFYVWTADTRITDQTGFGDAQGVEAYYEIAFTQAIKFTLDIQWIQPSQERVDSSWVVGGRLYTIF